MSSNHCVPDFRHIPRMMPALPQSQSDNNNNNSSTYVILLNTNPISSDRLVLLGTLPTA